MSLTQLHRRSRQRAAGEDPVHARRMNFVAEHEAELLTKVFKAFHVEGTPVDLNKACRIVATFDTESGFSFHEALFCVCFHLDKPGHFFHWRRNDLTTLDGYLPELLPEPKAKRRGRSKGASARDSESLQT